MRRVREPFHLADDVVAEIPDQATVQGGRPASTGDWKRATRPSTASRIPRSERSSSNFPVTSTVRPRAVKVASGRRPTNE